MKQMANKNPSLSLSKRCDQRLNLFNDDKFRPNDITATDSISGMRKKVSSNQNGNSI